MNGCCRIVVAASTLLTAHYLWCSPVKVVASFWAVSQNITNLSRKVFNKISYIWLTFSQNTTVWDLELSHINVWRLFCSQSFSDLFANIIINHLRAWSTKCKIRDADKKINFHRRVSRKTCCLLKSRVGIEAANGRDKEESIRKKLLTF